MDDEETNKVAYFSCLCKSQHKLLAHKLRTESYTIIQTKHKPELRKRADAYGIKMPFKVTNGVVEAL